MTSQKVTRGGGSDRGVRRLAVLLAAVAVSVAGAAVAANSGLATLACGPLLIGWG